MDSDGRAIGEWKMNKDIPDKPDVIVDIPKWLSNYGSPDESANDFMNPGNDSDDDE